MKCYRAHNTTMEAQLRIHFGLQRQHLRSGVGVWCLGFRVQGSGFRVQGSGLRAQGSGFRGFRVQGSGFRVQRSGLRGLGSRV
ncbi:hypothetical protein T484DRAFT_3422359 [Baffinella frigidus]|nr:hypothetical protein T484DRAFT_3422359 [Cryptophyta sp. CCMP2293]